MSSHDQSSAAGGKIKDYLSELWRSRQRRTGADVMISKTLEPDPMMERTAIPVG
ncbi:MAG: hypothetical protein H0V95_14780 [Actinobacteria bacterium]|nr:hypothetical protein [Actinomycetota bacterium]